MNEFVSGMNKIYHCPVVPLKEGGEAFIFDVIEDSAVVAKVYKPDKRTPERERKASVMVSNKPSEIEQYAWPLDVLYENGQFIGFIMPRVNAEESLRNFFVYNNRKGKPWSLFIAIAKNLSAAVHNLHEINQVIGDMNPENILVNPNNGMVTLIDTDSYHISDSDKTYRCVVGMAEYVAPELQGIYLSSAPLPTFTPESDRFALAVLIFELLMNGAHPFSCKTNNGAMFSTYDNIKDNRCVWFAETKQPGTDIPCYAPDFSALPDNIREMMKCALVTGHNTPALRPSAEDWYYALEQLEAKLTKCPKNPEHIFYSGAKECPWCKVEKVMK